MFSLILIAFSLDHVLMVRRKQSCLLNKVKTKTFGRIYHISWVFLTILSGLKGS